MYDSSNLLRIFLIIFAAVDTTIKEHDNDAIFLFFYVATHIHKFGVSMHLPRFLFSDGLWLFT